MNWTREQAIALCRRIEEWCPAFGCHVALTGGMLYKDGERKDCDLIFYRIRQNDLNVKGVISELMLREDAVKDYQNDWVAKFTDRHGRKIDVMIPNDLKVPPPEKERDEDYPE